jgi:hypothetical protein
MYNKYDHRIQAQFYKPHKPLIYDNIYIIKLVNLYAFKNNYEKEAIMIASPQKWIYSIYELINQTHVI